MPFKRVYNNASRDDACIYKLPSDHILCSCVNYVLIMIM